MKNTFQRDNLFLVDNNFTNLLRKQKEYQNLRIDILNRDIVGSSRDLEDRYLEMIDLLIENNQKMIEEIIDNVLGK